MHPDVLALVTAAAPAGSAGLLAGLATTRRRVRHLITDAARARWHSHHDTLTGLPNRAAARHRFHGNAATGRPNTIALLDLDDFKTVNDTWGHQAGDAQLTSIAGRLTTACRDIGALACRLGGDEFVLLLPPTDAETAVQRVTEIVVKLNAPLPLTVDDTSTVITHPGASAGIAVPEAGDSFSDLLRQADIALYHAKTQRTGPHLYTPGLRQPASHRHMGDLMAVRPNPKRLV